MTASSKAKLRARLKALRRKHRLGEYAPKARRGRRMASKARNTGRAARKTRAARRSSSGSSRSFLNFLRIR